MTEEEKDIIAMTTKAVTSKCDQPLAIPKKATEKLFLTAMVNARGEERGRRPGTTSSCTRRRAKMCTGKGNNLYKQN
jgi:hypothetical protein